MSLNDQLIFIHGQESSSQGFKANLLRDLFPGITIPDFEGALEERMARLTSILGDKLGWTIIGSSMGGLMAALLTCQHPAQVEKLILLAPALTWPGLADGQLRPVSVPTVVYHGIRDTVVPLEPVRALATRTFTNLIFRAVDDDHRLRETVQVIDWPTLVTGKPKGETRE